MEHAGCLCRSRPSQRRDVLSTHSAKLLRGLVLPIVLLVPVVLAYPGLGERIFILDKINALLLRMAKLSPKRPQMEQKMAVHEGHVFCMNWALALFIFRFSFFLLWYSKCYDPTSTSIPG